MNDAKIFENINFFHWEICFLIKKIYLKGFRKKLRQKKLRQSGLDESGLDGFFSP
jgi:hypothetical protein